MSRLEDAMKTLQTELLADEEYRRGWQANIAMAIHDTSRRRGESVHEWRNRCANTFLNYLTAGHPNDPVSNMGLSGAASVAVASGNIP